MISLTSQELILASRQAVQGGDRIQALEYLRQAHALDCKNLNIALDIASNLRELGQFDEAIQWLRGLLDENPTVISLPIALAQVARKQGDRELALSYFRRAHSMDSSHRTLANDIAVELRDLGRFQEAIEYLQTHEKNLIPELFIYQMGQIYLRQNLFEQAMKTFQLGIERFPQDLRCYQALLGFYQQYGLFDDALSLIHDAKKMIPDNFSISLSEVRCKMGQGNYEEVLNLCLLNLEKYPKEIAFWHHLIDLYIRMGEFDHAKKAIERSKSSLQINNLEQQQYLYRWLSELAKAQYQLNEAIDLANQGLEMNQQNLGLRNHRALLELMSGSTHFMHEILDQLKAKAPLGRRIWPSALGSIQGRLYSEMRTNPFVEKRLEAIDMSLEPQERIKQIAVILKDEPNAIAAGLQLLITLRANGFMGEAKVSKKSKADSVSIIPRNIVQFWDARDIPEDIQKTMKTWTILHPEYQYDVFDDQKALIFLQEHLDPRISRAFRMSNHAAMRADLFRLSYLYEKGGIYADADDACRARIDSWLEPGIELLLIQEHLGTVGNNFMAVVPKHPFIRGALDRIVDNILHQQGDIWFSSGPGSLTLSFCNYYLDILEQSRLPEDLKMITCFEAEKKMSMRLPRQYKQTEKSWSSPKNRHIPIYRPVIDNHPKRKFHVNDAH